MVDPDGGVTTYSHDAANRIACLVNPFAERTTFVHDVTGKPITQQNANGTWVSYSYDDAGRLTLLVNLKSDNTTLSSFLYSLNAAGDRTGVTEASGDTVTYSYDNAYQLTREERSGANAYDITYSYDPVGNRLTKIEAGVTTTYSYDAANQIETETTPNQVTTFTFDANRNTQVENVNGQLTTYTWSADNMCVGIALPSGALNTFAYDADLKRRQAEDSAGLAKFINDLDNVLLETDSGGTTQVAYTLEPATYGNLISQRRGDATAWHLYDALGSTERLTSAAEATLVQYMHKAFGLMAVLSGSSANRYTWIGRLGYRREPDAQHYDVRRRRMNPQRGAWLSADPRVSFEGLTSLYIYAMNHPLDLGDPSGLACIYLPSLPLGSFAIGPVPVSVSVSGKGCAHNYETKCCPRVICASLALTISASIGPVGWLIALVKKIIKNPSGILDDLSQVVNLVNAAARSGWDVSKWCEGEPAIKECRKVSDTRQFEICISGCAIIVGFEACLNSSYGGRFNPTGYCGEPKLSLGGSLLREWCS